MDTESKPGLALLRISGTSPPIYFVVEQEIWPEYDHDLYQHLFESKRCPKDIIGVEAVLEDGETDPHGIFEFVQIVERPEDWPLTGAVDWDRYRGLFSELKRTEPVLIDGCTQVICHPGNSDNSENRGEQLSGRIRLNVREAYPREDGFNKGPEITDRASDPASIEEER